MLVVTLQARLSVFIGKGEHIVINGKAKGNRFELDVAKMLTEWSGKTFHRTPQSGALHWDNDKRVVSDIVPPQDLGFPFSIECKSQEVAWDFDSLITGKSTIWKFWSQCCNDAHSENMEPLLVFSKNYRKIYAMLQRTTYNKLGKTLTNVTVQSDAWGDVVIIDFKELLDNVTLSEVLDKKF